MSRLTLATERFDAALKALEDCVSPLRGLSSDLTDAQASIQALMQERDELLARIARLEEENRSLSGLNHDVEQRLDGAIGDIRAALGR